MRYDSAVEKLGVAVHRLVGLGDIKDRLHQPYLSFEPLQPEQPPERDEERRLEQRARHGASSGRAALGWRHTSQLGDGDGAHRERRSGYMVVEYFITLVEYQRPQERCESAHHYQVSFPYQTTSEGSRPS